MERTFKRLLSFAVALVMVLGLIPVTQIEVEAATTTASTRAAQDVDIDNSPLELDANNMAVCPVCGGDPVEWIPITNTNYTNITDNHASVHPKKHYYLATNIGTEPTAASGDSQIVIQRTANTSGVGPEVCLHTNGKTAYLKGGIVVSSGGKLNVMGNGTLVGNHYSTASTYRGAVILLISLTARVNIYGSKIVDAAGKENRAIVIGKMGWIGAELNIYDEAEILGGIASYACSDDKQTGTNKINIYGGTIRNGVAADGEPVYTETDGGNIWLEDDAALTIHGGTISGGSATGNGGNIYKGGQTTTFTMEGGTVQNGTAANGGNLYLEENLDSQSATSIALKAGTIKDGTATRTENVGGLGGNIYVAANKGSKAATATDLLFGSNEGTLSISGGQAYDGGNIYHAKNNNCARRVSLALNLTLSDGKATNNGGNVFCNHTFMSHAVVKDGEAGNNGGNIYQNASVSSFVYNNKITGGVALNGGNIYSPYTVTLEGKVEVSGGEARQTSTSDGMGGNIKAKTLNVTSGAIVKDGQARVGGNFHGSTIKVAAGCSVTGGRAREYNGKTSSCNGGSLYITGTGSEISGTVSGGWARASGGNIYMSGTSAITLKNGGKIQNGIARYGSGGNIAAIHATITIEAGTDAEISGGATVGYVENGSHSGGLGGNIYAATGTKIYMNGGKISNGTEAGGTPASVVTSTTAHAYYGGNVYLGARYYTGTDDNKDGSTNVNAVSGKYDTITGLKPTEMIVTGGVIENATADSNGGNIYMEAAATLNLSGNAVVRGGVSNNNGGNVYMAAGTQAASYNEHFKPNAEALGLVKDTMLIMTGGAEISGGVAKFEPKDAWDDGHDNDTDDLSADYGNAGGGGNLFANARTEITMTNATIQNGQATGGGNVVLKDGEMTLNDGAQITGGTVVANKKNNDYYSGGNIVLSGGSGKVTLNKGSLVAGGTSALADGAEIHELWKCQVYVNGGTVGSAEQADKNTVNLRSSSSSANTTFIVNDGVVYGKITQTSPSVITLNHGVFSDKTTVDTYKAEGTHVYENTETNLVEVHKSTGVETPADCEKDGYTTYTCSYSNADLGLSCTDTYVVAGEKAGHKPVAVQGQEASHTAAGYKAAWFCDECDTYFADEACETVIGDEAAWTAWKTEGEGKLAQIEHTFDQKNTDEKYLKSEATCKEEAVYYFSCACGETGTETFTVEGFAAHAPVAQDGKNPEIGVPGWEAYYKCSVCEKLFSDEACANEIEKPVEIPALEETGAAKIGDVTYDTFEEALAAVQKGEQIDLYADVEVAELTVPTGVKLNLNGKTVKVTEGYVCAFTKGAAIIDESEGNTGRLDVAMDMLRLLGSGGNGGYLPVQMNGGIMFVEAVSGQGKKPAGNYQCWIGSADSALIEALKTNNASELGLEFQVVLTWGDNRMKYTFKDETVAKYIADWENLAMFLKITGAEGIEDLTYQARIVFGDDTTAEVVLWAGETVAH